MGTILFIYRPYMYQMFHIFHQYQSYISLKSRSYFSYLNLGKIWNIQTPLPQSKWVYIWNVDFFDFGVDPPPCKWWLNVNLMSMMDQQKSKYLMSIMDQQKSYVLAKSLVKVKQNNLCPWWIHVNFMSMMDQQKLCIGGNSIFW